MSESESKRVIAAHKFVLSISSPPHEALRTYTWEAMRPSENQTGVKRDGLIR